MGMGLGQLGGLGRLGRPTLEGVGWSPANLDPTKLKLWSPLATVLPATLDFQDSAGTTPIAADGDPLGLAKDKTANANDLKQASGANRPIYRGPTGPYVTFDALAKVMQTAAFSGAISQPYTIASVWKFDSLTTGYTVHDGIASGNRCSLYLNSPAVLNVYAGAAANVVGVTPDTNIHRTIIEVNGASSRIWYDGVEKSFSGSLGSHTLTGLTVGANNSVAAGLLGGSLRGVMPLIYAGQLIAAERANLDAYLRSAAGV